MTDTMKDFMTNLMFLMLPLFFIQVLWLDRPNRSLRPAWWHIGLLAGGVGILCMTFPLHITKGIIVDLRQVALIISLLYGGYRSGLLTAVLILGYRMYLGGIGLWGNLFTFALIFACYALIIDRFRNWAPPSRIIAAVALSAIGFFGVETFFYFTYPATFKSLSLQLKLLQYACTQGIAIWLVTYFIETMAKNQTIRHAIEQSRKMKLVSELAASVSHEVRNPLTVTRGFIQLLRKDDLPAEKRKGFIDLALEELDRAESIISDFLSMAKPNMEQADTLQIHQEIRYVSDVLTPYAAMNQVDIRVELAGECFVRGERDRFRQCLMNLAKNAIEAMPGGGILHIAAGPAGSHVEVVLTDTGTGMTSEQIERLGTPYYSTKEKGTGLGTMVVYSVVKTMGGRIKVVSFPGEGTRFTLLLPSAASPSNHP